MTTTKEFYEEKLSWGDRITSVIDKPHSFDVIETLNLIKM